MTRIENRVYDIELELSLFPSFLVGNFLPLPFPFVRFARYGKCGWKGATAPSLFSPLFSLPSLADSKK